MDPTPTFPTEPFVPAEPETLAPPPRRSHRALKLVAVVLGTVLLVGVPSAVALIVAMSRGSGDELARLAPASVDVYATALLDPSVSQKRNLESVLERFPQMRTQSDIQRNVDKALTDMFKDSGLDYKKDVQPWLGTQLAAIAELPSASAKSGAGVLLARTTNESAARDAMRKWQGGPQSTDLHWNTVSHGGVSIAKGTSAGGNETDWAVFDHTVAIASNVALLDQVIDTDQGRGANLAASSAYKQTLADLPSDHLGAVYVNAASVIAYAKKAIGKMGSDVPQQVTDAMASLDAYRSFGAALSLQPSAVHLDSVTETDPSKMSAAQRQQLSAAPHRNAMLGWVPADSYGVITGSGSSGMGAGSSLGALGLIAGLTAIGQQTGGDSGSHGSGFGGFDSTPPPSSDAGGSVSSQLDQLGITGPHSIGSNLTGESAFMVGPAHSRGALPVSAALVLGVKDENTMEGFLRNLGDVLLGDPRGVQVPWQATMDSGVEITYLDLPAKVGVQPAYALVDGHVVIGTDPKSVAAVLDAHRGGGGISSDPAFRGSGAGAGGDLLYLDVQRIVGAVQGALSGSDRADFDQNVAPDLKPLRTVVVTSSADEKHQETHLVVNLG